MKGLEIQFVSKIKKLEGKTVFLTGNSKSIGRAIALRLGQDGANVVLASDIDLSDIATEVTAAGGCGLYVKMDIRHEADIKAAVDEAVRHFNGIDILINNANLISSTDTEETTMKAFDEVQTVNVRGTYITIKACLPHLKNSNNPHILNISPPINLLSPWFVGRVSYTMAKYGMSMCVIGMAQEFKGYGIMVNALWPRVVIENEFEAKTKEICRKAEIMGDAAYSILTKVPKPSGLFYLDDQALKEDGITDFEKYCVDPNFIRQLVLNTFVDDSGIVYIKNDMTKKTMKLEKNEVGTRFNEILQRIESLCDENIVKKVDAIYHFTVKGETVKEAFLDLKSGSGKFRLEAPSDKPDVHVEMDDSCFYDIFVRGIRPQFAYVNGKLKVTGNQSKIILLNQLVTVCKSKL